MGDGGQRAPAVGVERAAVLGRALVQHGLRRGQVLIPVRRDLVGQAGRADQRVVLRLDDHIQQERPDVELAIDRALLADRRDHVIQHFLGDVGIPWLDRAAGDELSHLDEGGHADVDVPGALPCLGFSDELRYVEPISRGDLVIHARELRIHCALDTWMKILDPVVEGRGQWAFGDCRGSSGGCRRGSGGGLPPREQRWERVCRRRPTRTRPLRSGRLRPWPA